MLKPAGLRWAAEAEDGGFKEVAAIMMVAVASSAVSSRIGDGVCVLEAWEGKREDAEEVEKEEGEAAAEGGREEEEELRERKAAKFASRFCAASESGEES